MRASLHVPGPCWAVDQSESQEVVTAACKESTINSCLVYSMIASRKSGTFDAATGERDPAVDVGSGCWKWKLEVELWKWMWMWIRRDEPYLTSDVGDFGLEFF